jgi:zinc transport system ATP-binding protein
MNAKIIEFENISFSYGTQAVLDKITFSVNRNDFLGIIGPNGGGKTTLIKLMLGFLKPDSGKLKLFGKESITSKELQRIGYVPQRATNFDQNFPATVFEVASMGRIAKAGLMRQLSAEDFTIAEKALDSVDMLKMRDKRVGDLSGGQQQRVFIARALAAQPEVLILDEPLAGVDMESQHKFYNLLKSLHDRLGLTIILVSHDIGMITKSVTKLACVNVNVSVHDTSKGLSEAAFACAYPGNVAAVPHHHD